MRKLLLILLIMMSFGAGAHEGAHGPEQKVAPHGGVLRDSSSLMFELVRSGELIKIYPLTHDGKSIEAKLIEIDQKKTSLLDAKKKGVAYTLTADQDALVLKFERGSSYRYLLNLTARFAGKENKVQWQIELGSE